MLKDFKLFLNEQNKDYGFLKDYAYFFNTPEEMVGIADILLSSGFKVNNIDIIKTYREMMRFNYFIFDDHYFHRCTVKYIDMHNILKIDFKTLLELVNKGYLKKITRPDLDPFDEEDWGYENESNSNPNLNIEHLKKYVYIFDNEEDMVNIAKKLDELGFEVYNYNKTKKKFYGKFDNLANIKWKYLSSSMLNSCDFCRTSANRTNKPELNYYELLKLIDNLGKIKKITRPDVDPFDEEDWGYENLE